MKHLVKIMIIAVTMGLAQFGLGMADDADQAKSIKTMTAAELESTGDTFRAQKDYAQAIQYFRAALRKDSTRASLYNKLGIAELQSGDLRDARSAFEQAIKRDRKYADPVNNLGALAFMQKNYGSAARNFKKALALEETRASFHVNLGATWFAQSKLDRAIAEYTRALELDPDVLADQSRSGVSAKISTTEERAKYDYMVAKIYAKRGDLDRCLEALRKAKEEGYPNIGNVYKEQEFASLWQDQRLFQVVPVQK